MGGGKTLKAYEQTDISTVSNALFRYAKEDRWNQDTVYSMGFNSDAQAVIDDVAEMKLGFASDVANSVKQRNYTISEKQAYVIGKAALDNKSKYLVDNKTKELKVIFQKMEAKPKGKTTRQLAKAAATAHMPKKDNLVAAMKRRGVDSSKAWKIVNANYAEIAKSVTGGSTSQIVELFMKKV